MMDTPAFGSKADDVCRIVRAVDVDPAQGVTVSMSDSGVSQVQSEQETCLLLHALGGHPFSEPSLQLLQVALHLMHLIQAGLQVCMVLLQQLQMACQPAGPVLLH